MPGTLPALLVLAKEPVPGRVKTRLCPPCTADQAAAIAAAALADTLDVAVASKAARVVLVLDGRPGPWLSHDVEVQPQVAGGLGARLAGAFRAAGGPALLVGMDTPHLDVALLDRSLAALAEPGTDAVLGPAVDGGYWSIGLRRPRSDVFRGVPMSDGSTFARQVGRLERLGLRTRLLPTLADIDTFDVALDVARVAPRTRAAARIREVARGIADPSPAR